MKRAHSSLQPAPAAMRASWVAAALVAAAYAGPGQATTIHFDSVASGTVINTHYPGVTFGCLDGTASNECTGNIYAAAGGVLAESSPNLVGLSPTAAFFDNTMGIITATFSAPVSSVSIDANWFGNSELTSGTADPYLSAYGSTDNLLGTAWYPGAGTPHEITMTSAGWDLLSLSDSTNDIYSIQFSSSFDPGSFANVLGYFDNLSFSTSSSSGGGGGSGSGGGSGTGTVPEPGTLCLLAVGLAALRVYRSKQRRTHRPAGG